MFEIDFTKHKPQTQQNKTYLCNIRKRLISIIPEEEVRQSLINYLITEKGYPIENIQIEVPMSYFEIGAKGRADILIFDNDENVLCLIECKEPREYLTDNVLDQVERYDKYVKAETTCILMGSKIHFFTIMENKVIKLTEFPSFKILITHDGTITIGKLGAAKRKDLIDFIQNKKPELIQNGKIFLGKFQAKEEIKANSDDTKEFIKNCIEYAIIRDKFREYKKANVK